MDCGLRAYGQTNADDRRNAVCIAWHEQMIANGHEWMVIVYFIFWDMMPSLSTSAWNGALKAFSVVALWICPQLWRHPSKVATSLHDCMVSAIFFAWWTANGVGSKTHHRHHHHHHHPYPVISRQSSVISHPSSVIRHHPHPRRRRCQQQQSLNHQSSITRHQSSTNSHHHHHHHHHHHDHHHQSINNQTTKTIKAY